MRRTEMEGPERVPGGTGSCTVLPAAPHGGVRKRPRTRGFAPVPPRGMGLAHDLR